MPSCGNVWLQVDGLCATLAALLEQALGAAPAGAQQAGQADADAEWSADLAAALLARVGGVVAHYTSLFICCLCAQCTIATFASAHCPTAAA